MQEKRSLRPRLPDRCFVLREDLPRDKLLGHFIPQSGPAEVDFLLSRSTVYFAVNRGDILSTSAIFLLSLSPLPITVTGVVRMAAGEAPDR